MQIKNFQNTQNKFHNLHDDVDDSPLQAVSSGRILPNSMFRAKHASEKRLRLLFETEDEGRKCKQKSKLCPAQRIGGRLPPRALQGSGRLCSMSNKEDAIARAAAHAKIASQRMRQACLIMGRSHRARPLASWLKNDLVSRDYRPPTSTPMTTSWALLRGPQSSVYVVSFFHLAVVSATHRVQQLSDVACRLGGTHTPSSCRLPIEHLAAMAIGPPRPPTCCHLGHQVVEGPCLGP